MAWIVFGYILPIALWLWWLYCLRKARELIIASDYWGLEELSLLRCTWAIATFRDPRNLYDSPAQKAWSE